MNLAQLWIEVESKRKVSRVEMMERLSFVTKRKYDYKRLWEWEHGKRPIPNAARPYVLKCVMGMALRKAGIIPLDNRRQIGERLRALVEMLS